MENTYEHKTAWTVEDMQELRPDLTEEEALEVLQNVIDNHDEGGKVCYATLESWAQSMYPEDRMHSYLTEINVTLKMQLTINAPTHEHALGIAEQACEDCAHILNAQLPGNMVIEVTVAEHRGETGGRDG